MTGREEEQKYQESKKVVISWASTNKKTIMDMQALPEIRKSTGGFGYLYYNVHRQVWERPNDIQPFTPPPSSSPSSRRRLLT